MRAWAKKKYGGGGLWGSLLSLLISGHDALMYLTEGRYLQEVVIACRVVYLVYLFTGLVYFVHVIYTQAATSRS